jgi:oligopeptide transport system permease protein
MIPPILALSFGGIAGMARMLRAELAETLTGDFMLLAKAKGLTYGQTIWRHALRNACVPLATTFLYLFLGILGSSIVIENIFSVPGLSRTMIYAIQSNDHPLTMAIVYFYALIGLFMAILADLSYGVVDPRIRMGGRKNEE